MKEIKKELEYSQFIVEKLTKTNWLEENNAEIIYVPTNGFNVEDQIYIIPKSMSKILTLHLFESARYITKENYLSYSDSHKLFEQPFRVSPEMFKSMYDFYIGKASGLDDIFDDRDEKFLQGLTRYLRQTKIVSEEYIRGLTNNLDISQYDIQSLTSNDIADLREKIGAIFGENLFFRGRKKINNVSGSDNSIMFICPNIQRIGIKKIYFSKLISDFKILLETKGFKNLESEIRDFINLNNKFVVEDIEKISFDLLFKDTIQLNEDFFGKGKSPIVMSDVMTEKQKNIYIKKVGEQKINLVELNDKNFNSYEILMKDIRNNRNTKDFDTEYALHLLNVRKVSNFELLTNLSKSLYDSNYPDELIEIMPNLKGNSFLDEIIEEKKTFFKEYNVKHAVLIEKLRGKISLNKAEDVIYDIYKGLGVDFFSKSKMKKIGGKEVLDSKTYILMSNEESLLSKEIFNIIFTNVQNGKYTKNDDISKIKLEIKFKLQEMEKMNNGEVKSNLVRKKV